MTVGSRDDGDAAKEDQAGSTHYHLSVLLWNVWCLPGLLTDGNSAARARLISPLLNDYDIVILNEAFVHKDALLADVSSCSEVVEGPGRTWGTVFDSGLLVISKLPIVAVQHEPYMRRSGWDRFAAKGIMHCRLQVCSG